MDKTEALARTERYISMLENSLGLSREMAREGWADRYIAMITAYVLVHGPDEWTSTTIADIRKIQEVLINETGAHNR